MVFGNRLRAVDEFDIDRTLTTRVKSARKLVHKPNRRDSRDRLEVVAGILAPPLLNGTVQLSRGNVGKIATLHRRG